MYFKKSYIISYLDFTPNIINSFKYLKLSSTNVRAFLLKFLNNNKFQSFKD
jgi:hypothetical protein